MNGDGTANLTSGFLRLSPEPYSGSRSARFSFSLSADRLLRDHRVFGATVFPAAAYLELTLAAAAAHSISDRPMQMENVIFREVLLLKEQATRRVVLSIERSSSDDATFVFSTGDGSHQATEDTSLLVTGNIRWNPAARPSQGVASWDALQAEGEAISGERFYRRADARRMAYGRLFQTIQHAWIGPRQGLASVVVPEIARSCANRWPWSLLDAPFQLGAIAIGGQTHDAVACLPFRADLVRIHGLTDIADRLWCGVVVLGQSTNSLDSDLVADLWLFNDAWEPLVEIRGAHFRYVTEGRIFRPRESRSSRFEPAASAPLNKTDAKPAATGGGEGILENLKLAATDQRLQLLVQFIEEQVLEVLEWDESRREKLAQGFTRIGVDSMMAIDLQFRLQTDLDFAFPPGEDFSPETIPQLADYLLTNHLQLDC